MYRLSCFILKYMKYASKTLSLFINWLASLFWIPLAFPIQLWHVWFFGQDMKLSFSGIKNQTIHRRNTEHERTIGKSYVRSVLCQTITNEGLADPYPKPVFHLLRQWSLILVFSNDMAYVEAVYGTLLPASSHWLQCKLAHLVTSLCALCCLHCHAARYVQNTKGQLLD